MSKNLLYLKNVTKNRVWATTNPTAMRKLRSDLNLGRHTCDELQNDWDRGDEFVVVKCWEGEAFYRRTWRPSREIKADEFYANCTRQSDCLIWNGVKSFAGTTPVRVAAYLAGCRFPIGFPVKTTCGTPGCVKSDHLICPQQDDE